MNVSMTVGTLKTNHQRTWITKSHDPVFDSTGKNNEIKPLIINYNHPVVNIYPAAMRFSTDLTHHVCITNEQIILQISGVGEWTLLHIIIISILERCYIHLQEILTDGSASSINILCMIDGVSAAVH